MLGAWVWPLLVCPLSLSPGCPGPPLLPIHFLASQLAEGLEYFPLRQRSVFFTVGSFPAIRSLPAAVLPTCMAAGCPGSPELRAHDGAERNSCHGLLGGHPPAHLVQDTQIPCPTSTDPREASSQQISTPFLFCPVPISPNESPGRPAGLGIS